MKRLLVSFLFVICHLSFGFAQPSATVQHPWQGKRVAYFGDSITDPNNKASKKKFWSLLSDWLG